MNIDEIKIRLAKEFDREDYRDPIIASLQSNELKIKYLESKSKADWWNDRLTILSLPNDEEKEKKLLEAFESYQDELGEEVRGKTFEEFKKSYLDETIREFESGFEDSFREEADLKFFENINMTSSSKEILEAINKIVQYEDYMNNFGKNDLIDVTYDEYEKAFVEKKLSENTSDEEKSRMIEIFLKDFDKRENTSIFVALLISKFTEEDTKLAEALLDRLTFRNKEERLSSLTIEELQEMSKENEKRIKENEAKTRELLISKIKMQQATIKEQEKEIEELRNTSQNQEYGVK